MTRPAAAVPNDAQTHRSRTSRGEFAVHGKMRVVNPTTIMQPLTFAIDSMSRQQLREALRTSGIATNELAEKLLDDAVFDGVEPRQVTVVERSVAELGLDGGATLPQILSAAHENRLLLCPPTTGPYLRLALMAQSTAPDNVMSSGRAPSGSLTVASGPLHADPEYPRGFYLRAVDGRTWLRGYRCDDDFVWSPLDRFVFAVQTVATG